MLPVDTVNWSREDLVNALDKAQAELARLQPAQGLVEAVEKIDLRFVHQAKALIANTFGTAIDQYMFLEKLQKQIEVAQQALGGEGGKCPGCDNGNDNRHSCSGFKDYPGCTLTAQPRKDEG